MVLILIGGGLFVALLGAAMAITELLPAPPTAFEVPVDLAVVGLCAVLAGLLLRVLA